MANGYSSKTYHWNLSQCSQWPMDTAQRRITAFKVNVVKDVSSRHRIHNLTYPYAHCFPIHICFVLLPVIPAGSSWNAWQLLPPTWDPLVKVGLTLWSCME
jgi:hypothetical protein